MDLTARIKAASEQGNTLPDLHRSFAEQLKLKLQSDSRIHSLLAGLKPEMSGPARLSMAGLINTSDLDFVVVIDPLYYDEITSVSSDKAPFIWAALSLYWAQMASLAQRMAFAGNGEQRQFRSAICYMLSPGNTSVSLAC
ncbi:formate dehydrogenase accessory protein FdhE [Klebsiella pneumoniae]|uniref:formate dehydrogenase accessory protein FdhE domain-containing protein n=1 Tax=Klebsiella pneumoniae TaxID=573 RepID=UPI00398825FB